MHLQIFYICCFFPSVLHCGDFPTEITLKDHENPLSSAPWVSGTNFIYETCLNGFSIWSDRPPESFFTIRCVTDNKTKSAVWSYECFTGWWMCLNLGIWRPSNQFWLYHQNNKNSWKLYTNNRYITPNFLKLKRSNATKIFWFKVEGWYFQNLTEIMISGARTNESACNWPMTEWIHCDELLFTTTCHSVINMQTYFPFTTTMTDCGCPIKRQIWTTSLASRMFEM